MAKLRFEKREIFLYFFTSLNGKLYYWLSKLRGNLWRNKKKKIYKKDGNQTCFSFIYSN